MIHLDECSVEKGVHNWNLLDAEGDVTASIPFELAKDKTDAELILEQVAKGYNNGHKTGRLFAKLDLQRDLQSLLGISQ